MLCLLSIFKDLCQDQHPLIFDQIQYSESNVGTMLKLLPGEQSVIVYSDKLCISSLHATEETLVKN